MSSALSNQSCVHEGADYDEVYPSGQNNPSTLSEDRDSSATSPSRDEEIDRSEDSHSDNIVDAEPPIQFVIGTNGLREFIMFPIGTVNDFTSTIKETPFKTLREKYQILVNIPLCLPYKSEKCCYMGVEGIGVYKQMLKAGIRFPLSAFHYRLLQYLGLAVTQISPNTWRVFLGVEVLYEAMLDGARRLTVEEFFHCYHPAEIA